MSKTIGNAADFYRLRVMALDTTDEVDFEWRDDILYRRPPTTDIVDEEAYVVEAVLLDDEDATYRLARFADALEARDWMQARDDELRDMTKSEFEEAYFPDEAP
ncbi:MAG: hypothetical protein EG823_05020 [Actinobacteria bacterium]|nr:hypothetical protein [Actinomycetota bacterium]